MARLEKYEELAADRKQFQADLKKKPFKRDNPYHVMVEVPVGKCADGAEEWETVFRHHDPLVVDMYLILYHGGRRVRRTGVRTFNSHTLAGTIVGERETTPPDLYDGIMALNDWGL